MSKYQDVAAAGVDPLSHYLKYGASQGRKPLPARHGREFDSAMQKIASSGFFNPQWYIETNPNVLSNSLGPLEHYVRYGAFQGKSPGPEFDAAWYLEQYPDVAAAHIDPLMHFIDHGAAEGRKPKPPPGIIEAARSTLDSISDLEPDLYTEEDFYHLARLQIVDGGAKGRTQLAFRSMFNSLSQPYDYLVFIPWLTHGGAELVAIHAIKALIDRHGPDSVLVIVTDHDRLEASHWLPTGAELRVVSSFAPDLKADERTALVELLIQTLQPRCVLNVNSKACWDAFARHGQAFSTFTRLFATIFCRDYTTDGRPAGYADTHLTKCLPWLSGVYVDNKAFAKDLVSQFGLPAPLANKLVILRQPTNGSVSWPSAERHGPQENRFSVFWASRICRQKNIELLQAIVKIACRVAFDVWGTGEKFEEERLLKFAIENSNFAVKGSYASFEALPVEKYDAYLYTSLWDGIPNVLLEVASAGIPIVASNVGGVSEVVTPERGWLVTDYKNPSAYVEALYEISSNPEEANRRRNNMLDYVRERHSWTVYIEALSKDPGLLAGQ